MNMILIKKKKKLSRLKSMSIIEQDIHDKLSRIIGELDRVQEKMYDFEINKKNNLIFYGIPNEINEKEPQLILKIKELMKNHMKIRRDIIITSATRNGLDSNFELENLELLSCVVFLNIKVKESSNSKTQNHGRKKK